MYKRKAQNALVYFSFIVIQNMSYYMLINVSNRQRDQTAGYGEVFQIDFSGTKQLGIRIFFIDFRWTKRRDMGKFFV